MKINALLTVRELREKLFKIKNQDLPVLFYGELPEEGFDTIMEITEENKKTRIKNGDRAWEYEKGDQWENPPENYLLIRLTSDGKFY